MADLKISELAALAGGDLASSDLLPVVDVSASETKKITVQDAIGYGVTLIADASIPGAKILFNSASIPGSALVNGAVGATQVADAAITAAKLANESTVDLVTTLPGSGAFTGQLALDTDDLKVYCWDGSAWQSIKAAGSINTVSGDSSGVINISVTTTGDSVTIAATLDNTSGAAQFLAGPTAGAGAVSYRAIAAGDLPTATTGAKGAVQVNGAGLTLSGDTIQIDNTVTANTSAYHVVQYTAKGLVTGGRAIQAGDLPLAGVSTVGGMYPGSGLSVAVDGQLNHTTSVSAGTYPKVTFDAQGHVTAGAALVAADIPELSTDKLTSGLLPTDRIANNAVTGAKLANSSTAQFGANQPTAEYTGQLYFNSLSRDIYIWDGNVWQPIGISVGEIVLGGTYDANTNLVSSVTSDGTAVGLVLGQALPVATAANNRYYLVVAEAGTGVAPAPTVALSPPDIILSNGNAWVEIDVSQTITAQVASNVSFTPAGDVSSTNVQAAIVELDNEKLAKAGGTVTGELLIGTGGSFAFEGSTANAYETYLAVVDPTADRTITFPDVTGTVVTTGDTGTVTSTMIANGTIVDADINASAAISGSKIVAGTTSVVGVVQLTDSTSSTSTTTAATPNAVKSAYDLANAALPKAGGTLTGDVTLNAQSDLRFADSDSSNWVAFQAPATVASNVTWTLPSADGTSGQVLQTNGSATLSWVSPAGSYTITTTATSKTLVNKERCTVTASGQTITLPATPSAGDEVTITVEGTFTDTIISRNGSNLMSLAENMTIDKGDISVTLYYVDATRGWRII